MNCFRTWIKLIRLYTCWVDGHTETTENTEIVWEWYRSWPIQREISPGRALEFRQGVEWAKRTEPLYHVRRYIECRRYVGVSLIIPSYLRHSIYYALGTGVPLRSTPCLSSNHPYGVCRSTPISLPIVLLKRIIVMTINCHCIFSTTWRAKFTI